MGYTTNFNGTLKFTRELTGSEIATVSKFLDEDCRDHPEWEDSAGLTQIDLEFSGDFDGLKWNGMEKTYDLVDKVNLVITNVRKEIPDFGLTGTMHAQGERFSDRWILAIGKDGFAHKVDIPTPDDMITCPHCEEAFSLSEIEYET
jgi:hypothetical protein